MEPYWYWPWIGAYLTGVLVTCYLAGRDMGEKHKSAHAIPFIVLAWPLWAMVLPFWYAFDYGVKARKRRTK